MKPAVVAIAAVPAIIAVMIAIPLVSQPEIPSSALTPNDRMEIEYTKHQLKKISHGITERTAAWQTEILLIRDDGQIQYTMIKDGVTSPSFDGMVDKDKLAKLAAMIKETGFITIPSESFPISENISEYQKSSLRITLNGVTNKIHWPEQNATDGFVPPIITMVESELGMIINDIDDRYK